MATIHRCDRCKRDSETPLGLVGISPQASDADATDADLCPNCIRDLKRWLATSPPRAA